MLLAFVIWLIGAWMVFEDIRHVPPPAPIWIDVVIAIFWPLAFLASVLMRYTSSSDDLS